MAESESRALSPINEVKARIADMAPSFKQALPPHVTVEKFVRVVQTAVAANPDLADPNKCNRGSLYGAAMRLAQDGLLPDGREAAIVPFKGQAQAMPMIAGILKKVRQSGELLSIAAHVVYEKDDFDYVLGDDERIEHKPSLEDNRGKPIITYAIAKTKDGGIYREIMSEAKIQDVRKVSRSGDSGPWGGPFADEMRRKTVLRRLSKRLPMSTDVEELMRRDDALFMPPEPEPAPTGPTEAPPASTQGEQETGKRRPKALDKVVKDSKNDQAEDVIVKPAGTPAPAAGATDGPPPGHPANAPDDVI